MITVIIFIAAIILLILLLILSNRAKVHNSPQESDINEEYISHGTRKNIEDPKKL
ncbi:hypothetical protein ACFSTA_05130 [Ornithinibacillus salinisoli]|uniref:YtzI protein n=1 Tax=Ornithinibacillus salinisoli TaxID=1848459 RepID=A0ABW4VWA7_9BACI